MRRHMTLPGTAWPGWHSNGLELKGAVDGHDEVGLAFGVAVEGGAVFVTQLLGDGVGDGPAQDRQIEGGRGARAAAVAWAWSG